MKKASRSPHSSPKKPHTTGEKRTITHKVRKTEEIILPNSLSDGCITQRQKSDKDIVRKVNYRLISLRNIDIKILNTFYQT